MTSVSHPINQGYKKTYLRKTMLKSLQKLIESYDVAIQTEPLIFVSCEAKQSTEKQVDKFIV